MNTSTANTTTVASIALVAPLADKQPRYQHVGEGRFLPANAAAHEECRLWNAYADTINARTATTRSAVQ